MKTIGLLGGLSWESSAEYYRLINRYVQDSLGGLHSAKILMYSFDFQEIADLQHYGKWDEAAERLTEAAKRLEKGGADCVAVCSNTMHQSADAVASAINVPLIHIGEAAADSIKAAEMDRVALLGTSFTMEQNFYRQKLEEAGISVLIPEKPARKEIHRIIFDELCCGSFHEDSKEKLVDELDRLKAAGAQGAVLGCTELPLLVKQEHTSLPLFDTTLIHAEAIASFALRK